MAELSPAAQAVLDATYSRWPRSREWIIAAALRAAAQQIEYSSNGMGCLDILRRLATELENHQ